MDADIGSKQLRNQVFAKNLVSISAKMKGGEKNALDKRNNYNVSYCQPWI